MGKIALGTSGEVAQPDCIRALVVEFITTFLFVFVGVGSAITASNYHIQLPYQFSPILVLFVIIIFMATNIFDLAVFS